MSKRTSRRRFMQGSAVAGAAIWVSSVRGGEEKPKSPNEKIRVAVIGAGGKGSSDAKEASKFGDIVALCDIDETTLDRSGKLYPNAKKFFDFREMLDKIGKDIDAVTVSTADHCHAVAAAMAMKMGKHCFVQKPLTHTIFEARTLGELARKHKVATQMGNQFTANDNLRKAAQTLKVGALGKVKEVHVWTNRPIWPQGLDRPTESVEPPKTVKWDLWIGPAPMRPFVLGAYHPFKWRGWWDFGTGALGDMACHTFNMPFMGLNLRNPTSVVAECSGHNKDSYPARSKITFEFPADGPRPGLTVYWYDGGNLPNEELIEGRKMAKSGCLAIGDKGKLYAPGDYCEKYDMFAGASQPEVEFVKSPGHMKEWFDAMQGGVPAVSNFPDYASPLAETILLGNLAVWTADKGQGKKIEWDAKELKATNAPEVANIIKTTYRAGYTL